MQVLLNETANAIARTTGFIKRQRKLSGSDFVQTLAFGWLSNPDWTIEELAQAAVALDTPITPQGLDKRFTPDAANFLQKVLESAVVTTVESEPVAIPILLRFNGVFIIADLEYFSLDDFSDMDKNGAYWLSRVKSLCELYAKLIVVIIQHWILLTSWQYPDRSLFKSVKAIRKHAMDLARAFASGTKEELLKVLETIARCLSCGCRINKRKTIQHTYQLLLGVT